MNLYKYVPFNLGLKIISNNSLRFTQPKYFNDPFEITPVIKNIFELSKRNAFINLLSAHYDLNIEVMMKDSLKKEAHSVDDNLINNVASIFCRQLNKKGFLNYAEERMNKMSTSDYLENTSISINERFNRQYGILCLSETKNNIKMWSNYADNHQGMVIEFDSNSSFFDQRKNIHERISKLTKVKYVQDRPELTIFDPDKLDDEEWLNYIVESVIYTKSIDWEYEKEWRMVLSLEQANSINGDRYLFNYPVSCLSGVILGSKINEENSNKIRGLILGESRFSHVYIKQALLSKTGFEIQFNDLV